MKASTFIKDNAPLDFGTASAGLYEHVIMSHSDGQLDYIEICELTLRECADPSTGDMHSCIYDGADLIDELQCSPGDALGRYVELLEERGL